MSSPRLRLMKACTGPVLASLAVLAALASFAAPAVAVEIGEYEHVWRTQARDSASARQHVMSSAVKLRRNGQRYTGTIEYSDLLGTGTGSSGATSQESLIELKLTGERLSGERAVAGTFEGTVTFIVRRAGSLDEAVAASIRETSGDVGVYMVQGRWESSAVTGEAGETLLSGEVVYEQADGPVSPADGPAYLNRSGTAGPDGAGGAQLFLAPVEVTEIEGDGTSTVVFTRQVEAPVDPDRIGVMDIFTFILRGLTGATPGAGLHVPEEESRAARALLEARPRGATPLPQDSTAIDIHLPGHYLDAKNRAAGVQSTDHDFGAISAMRRMVPGIPAMPPDQDAGMVWAQRASAVLDRQREISGAIELSDEIGLVRPGADTARVARLRTWYHVGTATLESPFGTVLAPAASLAADVESKEVEEDSPQADAVLASFDAPSAPPEALQVGLFTPVEDENAPASVDGATPVSFALAVSGSQNSGRLGLDLPTVAGPKRIETETWLAYARDDDRRFWLAGPGSEYALTDASIRGWAFTMDRAALVDSDRCGRWVHVFSGE